MKEIKTNILLLNMKFVSLNEYIKFERSNKFKAASIKNQQTSCVYLLIKEQKFMLNDCKYDVIFIWHKPDNKKDHDNIAFAKKFILDGLVMAKVIQSDGSKFIGNFQDKFILDKSQDYVWCIVEFMKQSNS